MITKSIDSAVLDQSEVVLGQRGDEDDGTHVLEAVDPFTPLRPLTPYIHQAEVDLSKLEQRLLEITFIIMTIQHILQCHNNGVN